MDLFVKNKRYEILLVLVVVVFSSIWLSCGKKPISNSSSSGAGLGVVEVGDLKLMPTKGSKILSSVNSALTMETKLTPKQASEITSYAAGALAIKGTQGNQLAFKDDDVRSSYLVPSTVETPNEDTVDPDDMKKVPQTLIRWLIRATNLPSLNDFSLDEKIQIIGKISNSLMRSIYDKKDGMTDEEKNLIPARLSGSALSSLVKAGLAEGYDLNEGAREVSKEVVGSLSKAGYDLDSLDSVLEKNSEYSVNSIKESFGNEASASALENSIEGQVKGISNQGDFSLSEYAVDAKLSLIVKISLETVNSKVANKSGDEAQELIKRVSKGSSKGISSSNARFINSRLNLIVDTSVNTLKSTGIATNILSVVVDDIVSGAVSGLENNLFKGSTKRGVEKAKSITSDIVGEIVNTLADYGVNDGPGLLLVAGSIAESATSAIANMSTSNIKKSEIIDVTESIGSSLSSATYKQLTKRTSIKTDELPDFLASLSTRLMDGLRKSSFDRSDLLNGNSKISSGMQEGLSSQGASSDVITNFVASSESKLAELTSVDSLKKSCEDEKGNWDSKNNTCGVMKSIYDIFEGVASKRKADILSGSISTVKSVINNIIAKTNQASSSGDTSSVLDSRCEEAKDKVCKFITSPYSYNDAMNLCNCNSNCKWSENYTTRTREKCSQGLASCCILR